MAECELTSFHENTKITTNCLTTIDKRRLKSAKKTPYTKTKEEATHDAGGADTIKLKLIPAGWATLQTENNGTRVSL